MFKGNSQREAAINELRTKLAANPQDAHSYAKLGLLLLLQDKRQEAKMALRRAEALYRSQGHTDGLERIEMLSQKTD